MHGCLAMNQCICTIIFDSVGRSGGQEKNGMRKLEEKWRSLRAKVIEAVANMNNFLSPVSTGQVVHRTNRIILLFTILSKG